MCSHLLKEQEPAFTIKNKKSRLKVKLSLSGGMSFNMTAMAACVIMNSARCQVLDNFFQIQIFNDGGFIVCSNCAGDPCSATTPSLSTTILSVLETVRIRWAMMRTVLFFISRDIQDSFFIECDFSHKPQPRCTRSRWRYWYCSGSLRTSMWLSAPAWPVQYQEQQPAECSM